MPKHPRIFAIHVSIDEHAETHEQPVAFDRPPRKVGAGGGVRASMDGERPDPVLIDTNQTQSRILEDPSRIRRRWELRPSAREIVRFPGHTVDRFCLGGRETAGEEESEENDGGGRSLGKRPQSV